MNLGDGLLFELENGKPKLTWLNDGVEKNARKLSCRPRPGNILSTRQPTCVEKVQAEEYSAQPQSRRDREIKSKTGGVVTSTTSARKSASLTLTKLPEHVKGGSDKIITNGRSDRHEHSIRHGSHRAGEKAGQLHLQQSGTAAGATIGLRDTIDLKDFIMKNRVADLTAEHLQHILNIVETTCNGQGPSEDHNTRGNQTNSRCDSPVIDGEGAEEISEPDGEEEELMEGSDAAIPSLSKNKSVSGGLFSWLDGRHSASRAAISSKKAQWRRELDEQVAQKQQAHWSAAHKQQAEEERVSQVYKEQPAALVSNLRLGAITPIEEVLSVRRREEQKRRWLEELDKQREETSERRRREKRLQSQPEDHELWASHFESLQRKPPVPAAAPTPAPLEGLEQREWEPTSRLSLLSEAVSTCGGESVRGVAVEINCGHSTRASYLRTMTALMDPAQLDERDRRRVKQLELQRAIEAQVEEKRRQREQERAMKRKEEEEEERRLSLERQMLEKQYKLDIVKEKQAHHSQQAVQPRTGCSREVAQRAADPEGERCSCRISVCRDGDGLEEEAASSARTYKDTAVQTEAAVCLPVAAERVPTPGVPEWHQPPAPPPTRKNQAGKRGKENICRPAEEADPYEAFARTEQRKETRRSEWNAHRPSQQFVPASERYAASAQKTRQERRLRRQAELLALQGRSRLSRTSCAPPQEPQLCSTITQGRSGSTRKVSRGHSSSVDVHAIGRCAPAVPGGAQTQPELPSSTPPLPGLDFIPYVRTQEVLNLDPLEPESLPPPRTQAEATPAPSHQDPPLLPELMHDTHKLQETLRSLAQLRRGLLQKRREVERDLSPVLRLYENKPR